MSSAFQLTAQLKIAGPDTGLVVNKLRRDLGSVKMPLQFDKRQFSTANRAIDNIGSSAKKTSKSIKVAKDEMKDFGRVTGLAIRRFAGFTAATAIIYGFSRAITSAIESALSFEVQMIKVAQVQGTSVKALKGTQKTILALSTSLGVSSDSLVELTRTLSQAGITGKKAQIALKAIAQTDLAPTFSDMNKTAEGSIAIFNQFKIGVKDLDKALGSVNAVAGKFAVEADDIISAVRRTGGVFAAASKDIRDAEGNMLSGLTKFQQFISLFTSVRSTTREAAETIATGLRTIFTRIQRRDTIDNLRSLGVELQDTKGQFVGNAEAVNRLGIALRRLNPRDQRFADIAEQLGGFRQIGKTIPLILQVEKRARAFKVAQEGVNSVNADVESGLKSVSRQWGTVREEFKAFVLELTQSSGIKETVKLVFGLTKQLINLGKTFKDIVPLLGILGGLKLAGLAKGVIPGVGFGLRGKNLPGLAKGTRGPGDVVGGNGVVGGRSGIDQNLVRLSRGEIVMNAGASKQFGASLINLNKGRVPGLAKGTYKFPYKGKKLPPGIVDYKEEFRQKKLEENFQAQVAEGLGLTSSKPKVVKFPKIPVPSPAEDPQNQLYDAISKTDVAPVTGRPKRPVAPATTPQTAIDAKEIRRIADAAYAAKQSQSSGVPGGPGQTRGRGRTGTPLPGAPQEFEKTRAKANARSVAAVEAAQDAAAKEIESQLGTSSKSQDPNLRGGGVGPSLKEQLDAKIDPVGTSGMRGTSMSASSTKGKAASKEAIKNEEVLARSRANSATNAKNLANLESRVLNKKSPGAEGIRIAAERRAEVEGRVRSRKQEASRLNRMVPDGDVLSAQATRRAEVKAKVEGRRVNSMVPDGDVLSAQATRRAKVEEKVRSEKASRLNRMVPDGDVLAKQKLRRADVEINSVLGLNTPKSNPPGSKTKTKPGRSNKVSTGGGGRGGDSFGTFEDGFSGTSSGGKLSDDTLNKFAKKKKKKWRDRKFLKGGSGLGAALLAPALIDMFEPKGKDTVIGGALGGGITAGFGAQFAGLGPAGMAVGAIGGAISGASNADIANIVQDSQAKLKTSTEELDKAFVDFGKSGVLSDLLSGFESLNKALPAAIAAQEAESGGILGSVGRNFGFTKGITDTLATGFKVVGQEGVLPGLTSLFKASVGDEKAAAQFSLSLKKDKIENAQVLQATLAPQKEAGIKFLESQFKKQKPSDKITRLQDELKIAEEDKFGVRAAKSRLVEAQRLESNQQIENVFSTKTGREAAAGLVISGADTTTDKGLRAFDEVTNKQKALKTAKDDLELAKRSGTKAEVVDAQLAVDKKKQDLESTAVRHARGLNLTKDLKSEIDAENALERAAAASTTVIVALSTNFETMSAIAMEAANATQALTQEQQALITRIGGGTAVTGGVQKNVFKNLDAFSTGGISDAFGRLTQNFGDTSNLRQARSVVTSSEKLRRNLPDIINDAAHKNPLGPSDSPEADLLAILKTQGLSPDLLDIASGQIKSLFGKDGGRQISDLSADEIRKFVDDLASNMSESALKSVSKLETLLNTANTKYVAAVNQSVQIQKNLNQQRAALGGGAEQALLDRKNLFGNKTTLQERLRPLKQQLGSTLGGTGVAGSMTSPADIGRNIERLRRKGDRLNESKTDGDSAEKRASITDALAKNELAIAKNISALELLSKNTVKLAFIQERIVEIQRRREAAGATVQDVASMDIGQRRQFGMNLQAFAQFQATGNIGNGGPMTAAIIAGFNSIKSLFPKEKADAIDRRINAAVLGVNNTGALGLSTSKPGDTPEERDLLIQFANAQKVQFDAKSVLLNLKEKDLNIYASNSRIILNTDIAAGADAAAGARIGRAGGGFVPGSFKGYAKGGTVDSVPAMLTPGEFVVKRSVAQKNKNALTQLNSGVQGLADGGFVNPLAGRGIGGLKNSRKRRSALRGLARLNRLGMGNSARADNIRGFLNGKSVKESKEERREKFLQGKENRGAAFASRKRFDFNNRSLDNISINARKLDENGDSVFDADGVQQAKSISLREALGGTRSLSLIDAIRLTTDPNTRMTDFQRLQILSRAPKTPVIRQLMQSIRKRSIDNGGQSVFGRGEGQADRGNTFLKPARSRNAAGQRFQRAGFTQGFAKGGTVDSVPAMLTPGEFVVRKSVADKHRGDLTELNNGGSVGGAANTTSSKQGTSGFGNVFKSMTDKFNESATQITEAFNKLNILEQSINQLSELNIPSTIELKGTHEVNVNINGGQVLADSKEIFKDLIINEVKKSLAKNINNVTGETQETFV